MNPRLLKFTLAATAAAAMPMLGHAQELARVVSATPILQRMALPQQVCSDAQVVSPAPRSGAGALVGALAGGAIGNAVGQGTGRAVATALGLFGGAIAGDKIEGGGAAQIQNVSQCTVQTSYQDVVTSYSVVYEYAGREYTVQLPRDPGSTLPVQVTPVGASISPGNSHWGPGHWR
jgi:uncharacterized protein YcfJ